jgi:hypothetical protein
MLIARDGRLSTQGGSKRRREAVVWTDPGIGRSTLTNRPNIDAQSVPPSTSHFAL